MSKVKSNIFDSWDWMELVDDFYENWEEYFSGEEKPETDHDERLYNMAYEYIQDDYYNIVEAFQDKTIPGWLLLSGHLGLWWGKPEVGKVVTQKNALDWMHDEMTIAYEDGDIAIYHYHHDGTNCLNLYVIKPFEDVDLTGLTEEQVQKIRECYDELEYEDYFDTENLSSQEVDRMLASAAPYLEDYMSQVALDDLAARKAQNPSYYNFVKSTV